MHCRPKNSFVTNDYHFHHERSSKTFVMALSGCFETDVQCLRNNQTEQHCYYVRAPLKAELTALRAICKYKKFSFFFFSKKSCDFLDIFPCLLSQPHQHLPTRCTSIQTCRAAAQRHSSPTHSISTSPTPLPINLFLQK